MGDSHMSSITAARVLETWEDATGEHPIQRALTLLRLAEPDASIEALALLPIGERDRRLIGLRERLIGPRFDATAACPACGERIEMSFTADQITPAAPASPDDVIEVVAGELRIRARVPTTADLAAAAAAGAAVLARSVLLSRCILSVTRDGVDAEVSELPASAVDAVQQRLADADPFAILQLDLTCPACAHPWQLALDPAGYLWRELDERAQRLLRDVHALARGYGWREQDILTMGETRRRAYLALLGEA